MNGLNSFLREEESCELFQEYDILKVSKELPLLIPASLEFLDRLMPFVIVQDFFRTRTY